MRLTVVEPSSGFAMPENGPRSIGAVRVLRLSITDRCNFRCVYCMPQEGVPWLPKQTLLSFEEIVDIARAAVEFHGIRRFKITGGEPTVRHGVVELVRMLRAVPGVADLSLTTNGMLLDELAHPLRDAGLDRVTISIDSLVRQRFRRITRTGDLARVLRGLASAQEAGFGSIKINCVTMRGTNDDELVEFARLTLARPLTVRFIEYMPLGDAALLHEEDEARSGLPEAAAAGTESGRASAGADAGSGLAGRIDASERGPAGGCGAQDRGAGAFISETEARQRIEAELGELLPVERDSEAGVGPATVWRLAGARGRIGFISAMSAPFCATCNRLRLTADGVLRSCLFEGGEVDVRRVLRDESLAGHERLQAVAQAMSDCVRLKPEVHSRHGNQQMSRIGG